jgi:hypothetical protein
MALEKVTEVVRQYGNLRNATPDLLPSKVAEILLNGMLASMTLKGCTDTGKVTRRLNRLLALLQLLGGKYKHLALVVGKTLFDASYIEMLMRCSEELLQEYDQRVQHLSITSNGARPSKRSPHQPVEEVAREQSQPKSRKKRQLRGCQSDDEAEWRPPRDEEPLNDFPRMQLGSDPDGSRDRDMEEVDDELRQRKYEVLVESLKPQFDVINMIPGNVPADGNCLFHAAAKGLNHVEGHQIYDHSMLRAEAVNYIESHREEFRSFLHGEEIEKYIAKMRRPGTWGDNLVLAALAKALNTTISVYQNTTTNQVLEFAPNYLVPLSRRIYVLFLDAYGLSAHYASLIVKRPVLRLSS